MCSFKNKNAKNTQAKLKTAKKLLKKFFFKKKKKKQNKSISLLCTTGHMQYFVFGLKNRKQFRLIVWLR